MIKILLVVLAYCLVYSVDYIDDAPFYYAVSSVAYMAVCITAVVLALKIKSKLLHFYAVVNLFASVFNLVMVSDAGYYVLRHWYWYSTLNFCLIINTVELVLLLSGAGSVAVYLLNCFFNDTGRRTIHTNSMVYLK